MVRKLKYNEQKLLKKTDFITWETDQSGRQNEMMAKYGVSKRAHYVLYNKLAAKTRALADKLKELPANDPYRVKKTRELMGKMYSLGLIASADSLERVGKICGSSFARRRLPVVMKKSGMVNSVNVASDYVEQGHVRVGVHLVNDPAFLVTRNFQDAITWTRGSKIREKVLDYNDARDDFDLA
ncbi:hypothetical protein PMAYCL1PPCAC_23333 [Pristionchus mayeri]|uniref:Small ribosomal subunit protein uS4 N-terminal domain-containing protein n=1 Tax=Pristionchus mayeri TaxID=1317129 RepID=A0AAN5CYG8_9BILA|nr:hypothetical protein PMAYCL1PPCAC_23333 [Pristionchus mayeri]